MTKKEIARHVYTATQLSLVDSQAAVQATLDAISKLLVKHGRVELRGFGVFSVHTRAARKAHNPRSGEEVQVEEHDTVVFKPSKLMKSTLDARRAAKAKKASTKKSVAKKTAKESAAKKGVKETDAKTDKKTGKNAL